MKQYKPTTKSQRFLSHPDYGTLSKEKPMKASTKRLKTHAGRNNQGRITMRHQGGGVKKLYRMVDFKQNKMNVPGKVLGIEYDPYRSAFIARVVYKDGEKSYIIAPDGLKTGDAVITAENAPLKTGNRLMIKNVPVGYKVHNVELQPGQGGKIARSAGGSAEVLAHEDGYSMIKLNSGEVRKVLWNGLASLGAVSNPEYALTNLGKAGRSRWLGIRPTVRGTAMNPVDHPYGGGEGRQRRGTRKPKTLWGKITGGRKTRNPKKWSSKLIVKRRVSKRNSK